MVMIWEMALVNDTPLPTMAVRASSPHEKDKHELKRGHLLAWPSPNHAGYTRKR